MSKHRNVPPVVPSFHTLAQPPSEEFADPRAGNYSFAPAMSFKEIARRLGVNITEARRDFNRGMTKLRRNDRLFLLWIAYESAREESTRRMPTPYARTLRQVIDVPASNLSPIAEEAQR